MRIVSFFVIGLVFGITMTQAEIISWFRIQEMFRFQAFHMYGIIGSAIVLGIIVNSIIKKTQMRSIDGLPIDVPVKKNTFTQGAVGGLLFGIGWALTGACPGPMFVLIGNGALPFVVVLISALLGAFSYGVFSKKLPK